MDYLLSSELVVRDRHQQSVLYIYIHIKQPETQSESVSPMDYLLSISNNLKHKMSR